MKLGTSAFLLLAVSALQVTFAAPAPAPAAEVQLHTLRASTEVADQRARELQAEIRTVRMELEKLESGYAAYRDRYQMVARLKAVGESHPVLACLDGREFRDVVVREVNQVGVSIRHRDGSARIPYQSLPPELRDRFQWNPREAREALALESEQATAREQATRLAFARLNERKVDEARQRQLAEEQTRRVLAAERSRLASLVSASASRLDTSGTLGERRSLGGSSSYYHRYSRYYDRPTVYYYPATYSRRAACTVRPSYVSACRPSAAPTPRPVYRPAGLTRYSK